MLLFCKVIALLPFLTDGQPLEESRRTVRENSGEEAVLPCHLSEAVCDWLKDGWLLDMGGRYKTRENCHLVISPVLPLDQGQFQCQVGGERAARSPVVNLSVNTEPGQPHIKEGDTVMADTGETLHLTCQSGGAKPAAEIEWWNEETGERIVSEVTQHVQRTGDAFLTTSVLKLSPADYTEVICTAHSQTFPTKRKSSRVQISIRGNPRREDIQLEHGESIKIFCYNDYNNILGENVKFKWFINDNQIYEEESDILNVTKFSKAFDKTEVKCAIENSDGQEEVFRKVRLLYKPNEPFPENIKSHQNYKKKKTFICVSTTDDEITTEPKYVWIAENPHQNKNYDYNSAAADQNIKCQEVENISGILADISVELKAVSRKLRKFSNYLEEMSGRDAE